MSTDPQMRESMQAIGELAPVEVPNTVGTIFAMTGASAVRGAIAAVYFAADVDHVCEYPLYVLDYDVKPIESALPTYLSDVFARLAALRAGCRIVLYPEDIALYAEPTGLGKVVLLEAYKSGHDVREVRDEVAELKLEDRATPALMCVYSAPVKFAKPAFDKVVNFRGTAANHLRRQIAEYSRDQRADDFELFSAWRDGILQALHKTGSVW